MSSFVISINLYASGPFLYTSAIGNLYDHDTYFNFALQLLFPCVNQWIVAYRVINNSVAGLADYEWRKELTWIIIILLLLDIDMKDIIRKL